MTGAVPLERRASLVTAAAASLLLVDLFLGWQRVAMQMGGFLYVGATASGWSGWGALAGVCAIAVLVVIIARGPAPAVAALALGAVLFTAVAVLAGHAHVDVGAPMMRAQVHTTLWPAWAGLALAGVMARCGRPVPRTTPRARTGKPRFPRARVMLQVRIHGRGGQGVVTSAELLSSAAFLEGRHAQAFPSFGSERTGTPVVAFSRIYDRPIRTREPIAEPDLPIVQDPTLLHQVDAYAIDLDYCKGCGLCAAECPAGAITMQPEAI
jgi:hypothetical protein